MSKQVVRVKIPVERSDSPLSVTVDLRKRADWELTLENYGDTIELDRKAALALAAFIQRWIPKEAENGVDSGTTKGA